MTSGRLSCTDCGRNSPQGRHASCQVLAELQDKQFPVRSDFLSGRVFGYHDPDHRRLHGAIQRLRNQGHSISTIGGGWSGCSYRLNAAPVDASRRTA